ncbi:uncharacterized protein LOC119563996 isoform X1 [Chelonia mydas]|uniref:uncharacterized protein LOC119563996 isoform X1 n=1 Tax=Chelonia mydas TaxID=8469 RepID=UPI001CA90538|nr:uncharacterized protein LOC119563996 isoform X1 [Chelonia mydas]
MLLRMLDPSKDSGLLKRKFCIERNGNSKEKGMTSDISITHIFGQCMLLPKRSIMVLTQNEQRKQKAWKSQLHVKYRRKILHTPLLSVCVSRFPDSVPKIPLLPPLFPSQPPVPLNSAKLSYQLTISGKFMLPYFPFCPALVAACLLSCPSLFGILDIPSVISSFLSIFPYLCFVNIFPSCLYVITLAAVVSSLPTHLLILAAYAFFSAVFPYGNSNICSESSNL